MGKVIKSNIVDNIYTQSGIDRQIVQSVIDSFLDEVKLSLKRGDSVELRGFGVFKNKLRKAKENARNPKDGKKISVPSHYVASFKAGKELEQALWDLKIEK